MTLAILLKSHVNRDYDKTVAKMAGMGNRKHVE